MVQATKGGVVIKPIDKASVHRICSGQVILDLSMAVKELVENSLDAGSTSIEIKLKEYGQESLEVADNGCGVSPDNYQALTLKYHTSKISEFADLQSLSSFGFRGEALSSLCALGELSVVTRNKNESVATQLQFDRSGSIVSQKNEARPVGTTVIVSGLFKSLPVRYKEFTKNIRREYSRLLTVLHGYALIAKNVRLVCSNLTGKTRSIILKTQGTSSIKDNIITVFGTKMAACLEPVNLSAGSDCQIEGFISKPGSGSGRASGDRQFFYINNRPVELPKISKMLNELYKCFNSQQYPMAVLNFILPTATYDVNVTPDKRKVFLHAESELLTAFRQSLESIYAPEKYTYTVHTFESTVLEKASFTPTELPEFETQRCTNDELSQKIVSSQVELLDDDDEDTPGRSVGEADVNNSDFACKSSTLSNAFRADLDSFQCKVSVVSTNVNTCLTGEERQEKANTGLTKKEQATTLQQKATQSKLTEFVLPIKRPAEDNSLSSEEPMLKKWLLSHHGTKNDKVRKGCILQSGPTETSSEVCELDLDNNCCDNLQNTTPYLHAQSCNGSKLEGRQSPARNTAASQSCGSWLETSNNDLPATEADCGTNLDAADGPSTSVQKAAFIHFDIKKLQTRFVKGLVRYEDYLKRGRNIKKHRPFLAASMGIEWAAAGDSSKEEALAAATRELERTFNKADFKKMKVLGQFNLGFILAKLNGDLFIIDQHASDEKYNFERLSKTTVLNCQPLLRPLPLDCCAAEEVIVTTHIETFRKNGFEFIEKKDGPPGRRLFLSAVPFSKNITFGSSDVQEMVSLLAEEPISVGCEDNQTAAQPEISNGKAEHNLSCVKSLVRPSRVRAMLASRACRSSIMIGDALSKKEMQKVLSHLAELDSPWNCPHGRPTMRHLADLTNIKQGGAKFAAGF